MSKNAFQLTLLVAMLVCLLPAARAQALVLRTFVSAAGSDSNNCANTVTPCRHFAAAFAATAAGGEIYVLDPANYGSLTITHAVSIQGHGWGSVSPPAGSAAIIIAANPGDVISLQGLTLGGGGISSTDGIVFTSGTKLEIVDCTIRDFTSGEGIAVSEPPNNATLTISNSILANNQYGIFVITGGAGFTLTADRVLLTDNQTGANLVPQGGGINATFANSILNNNTTAGIDYTVTGGVSNLTLVNTNFNENASSVKLNGNLNLYLSHVNDINPTSTGLFFNTSSGVSAFGDRTNHVTLSGPGAPTQLDSWALQ